MTLEEKLELLTMRVDALEQALAAKKRTTFKPPTPAEVRQYSLERGSPIDGEAFCDFYESKGWLVGKVPMKCWKAAARNWSKNRKPNAVSIADKNSSLIRQTGGVEWIGKS